MGKIKARVKDEHANIVLGRISETGQYRITKEEKKQIDKLRKEVKVKTKSKSDSNDYKDKGVLSALNDKGKLMNIDEYCAYYNLPKADISSYKLVTHTGTPFFNIVFREVVGVESIDFDKVLSKYKNFEPSGNDFVYTDRLDDFDVLTYSDTHIAMDTNADNNSMYAEMWGEVELFRSLESMTQNIINDCVSSNLVIDELGDFLDGLNGYTTRGGHKLPQNMTDEDAFDIGLKFKIELIDRLHIHFETVTVNNICNDNHAGSFGYFVNSAAKNLIENKYENVTVNNHRQFINHYFIGDICFLITHGKDDKTLKFGFKPQLDSKGLEKIDQYCKQNDIYKKAKKIVFKKGDSHQALFDMCTSDDFYYFNYPALSPSSQWVQNNFKKGRRGFVLETWKDLDVTIKPIFL
jgi:hypothetical protein